MQYLNENADSVNLRNFVAEVLSSSSCPAFTMNIDQLDGYLRALAAEPEVPNQNKWISLVFGGDYLCDIGAYSWDSIRNALIGLYNEHRAQILIESCELNFSLEFSLDRTDRLKAEQWARGFMQGYIFWDHIWSGFLVGNNTFLDRADILPPSTDDDIDAILVTISAVADADYALQNGASIQGLTLLFKQLPERVIDYDRIARRIRESNSVAP